MSSPATLAYDFVVPGKIVFGWGRSAEIGSLCRSIGRRALLVVGSRTLEHAGYIANIRTSLREHGVEVELVARLSREPTVGDVDRATAQARNARLRTSESGGQDFVLAIGGGAAMDLGKAIAGMVPQSPEASVRDYLEGVGRDLKMTEPPLPIVLMPTTGGTGSEATKNAVVSGDDEPFKKSLRDERLLARLVVIDPELAVGLPAAVTIASGMDAITQLIESYLTRRATRIPQALCLQGLAMAAPAIRAAVASPETQWARENLAHAALLSGMALANSGLGLAHGVAAALGSVCGVAHGLACATMLPVAMRVNKPVRTAELAHLAAVLTPAVPYASAEEAADGAIAAIEQLSRELGVPQRLSELGVTSDQLPRLVAASHGNSLRGNPRDLSDDELHAILEEHL